MKKFSIIILSLFVALCFTGCNKTAKYDFTLYSSCDCIDIPHSVSDWYGEKANYMKSSFSSPSKNEERHGVVKTNIGDIEADFQRETIENRPLYSNKKYIDMDGNVFFVNSSGEVVRYIWSQYSTTLFGELGLYRHSMEECMHIANEFVSRFAGLVDYIVTHESFYDKGRKLYKLTYTKRFNGIDSDDSAEFIIDEFGVPIEFNSLILGKIPKATIIDFDDKYIKKRIKKIMKDCYSEIEAKLGSVQVVIDSMSITALDDNTYGVDCKVRVSYFENENMKEHLFCFLVTEKDS